MNYYFRLYFKFIKFNLSALDTTLIEDKDIAAAAKTGFKSGPPNA